MLGFQEMIFVAAIILGILFIPRMIKKRPMRRVPAPRYSLSGRVRLVIAASFLYPAVTAAYFRPWVRDPVLYLYVGVGPVILGWLLFWVYRGFSRR